MKKIKLLFSVVLIFASFFAISQEWNGDDTNSDTQAKQPNKVQKPHKGQQMMVLKENNKSSEAFAAVETAKYEVRIAPVTKNKPAVTKLLIRFLGSDKKGKVNMLVKNGGTVMQNLNQQAATNVANELRKLGVRAEVLSTNNSASSLEANINDNDNGQNQTSMYEVNIKPVKSNQAAVLKFLLHQLGTNEKNKVSILIKHGGTVTQNLNQQAANSMANQLQKLGVTAEVNTMSSEVPKVKYLVKMLSSGKNKVNVIKVVRNLTNLSLKQSKDIVDNLDVVEEGLTKKVAEQYKRMLENAGAIVRIESMSSLNVNN
ncbi:hypothetical protein DDV96_14525 [Marixanthomonas spongiae]|uniref:Large ribosomal subunit protein bL12 C-terminal domain-containing protein n=2 Tax=Marixanthomonas spongiae TaxID=2174845 RepID=A0A2U0HVG4_9FLAO|nr:hypothetical protein DDV96_14525 [Marixanthomonas spongiae]